MEISIIAVETTANCNKNNKLKLINRKLERVNKSQSGQFK